MDVDTALSEVPVNIMPLIDDTDFKTIEDAIAYNAAGMDLTWNFSTTAGAFTSTSVTPTTAGIHDWNEHTADDGMYTLEIPASGGTINNDTEGFGWFTGVCTGVLPWRGPVIGFRAADLNNALIDGGDNLDVNTVQWLGTACATPTVAGVPEVDLTHMAGGVQTVTDLKDFADAGYDPATNKVQGVVLVDTCTANTDLVSAAAVVNEWETQSQADPTGFHVNVMEVNGTGQTGNDNGADINTLITQIGTAGNGLTAIPWNAAWDAEVQSECTDALNAYDPPTNAEMAAAFTEIKGATWAAGTDTLEHIRNKQTDIETDTAVIGALGAGLTAIPWNPAWDAEVQSECTDALNAYDPPTKAEMDTGHGLLATEAKQDTIDGIVDTILVDTNELQGDWTNGGRLDLILDAVLAMLDDARGEPGQGAPPVNPDAMTKLDYLYKFMRNKILTSATEVKVYNDAGDTIDQKSTISDDGTDFTRGEFGTGA
jgi:phage baseplate assembly protein W